MDSQRLARLRFGLLATSLLTVAALLLVRPAVAAPVSSPPPPPIPAPDDAGKTATASRAPLVFEGETLAVMASPVGPFTAVERAEAAADRLERAVGNWELDPTKLEVRSVEAEGLHEILVGGRVILAVTDEDARSAGLSRQAEAEALSKRLRDGILKARHRRSARWLLLGGLKTGLATVLFVASAVIVRVVSRRLRRRLEQAGARARQQESLLPFLAHIPCLVISLSLRILTWPAIAVLGMVYLHFVLDFFPSTMHLARSLDHEILSVLQTEVGRAIAYSPNLLVIALILTMTRGLLRGARAVLEEFERGHLRISDFSPDWARPTYNILRSIVLALMVVVIYPYLPGSDSAAFRGVSVFVGLLLSLGSSSVTANAVAGTILTYLRAMHPGDFVQLGDLSGVVVDKSLLVTRIRTNRNEVVTIPNGLALSTQVRNYSVLARQGGVILATSLPVGYDVPWRTVHNLLLEAARETDGVLDEPAPFVLQTSMTENFVRYELNVHTDRPERQPMVLSALHQNIQDQFHEAGISISSPNNYLVLANAPEPLGRGTPPLKVAP